MLEQRIREKSTRTAQIGKVQTRKGVRQRTPQHMFPLELKCDLPERRSLNAEAAEYRPKPQASKEARMKIQAVAADEQDLE